MDYTYAKEFQLYRQLLFQAIKRAKELNLNKIDFGVSATFEKRKLGATIIPKVAYIQARDNFSMELMGTLQNEDKNTVIKTKYNKNRINQFHCFLEKME